MLCENIDQKQRSLCRMRKSIVNIAFDSIVTTFRETTIRVSTFAYEQRLAPGASTRYVLFPYVRKDASCLLHVLNLYFTDRINYFHVERWYRERKYTRTYLRYYVGKYIQNTCTWEDGRENNYSVRKSADSCNPMVNTLTSY